VPIEIDREEVQRLVAAGAQLVEVLGAKEYEEEHLAGAISLPLRRIDAGSISALDPNRAVIVYCWDMA